VEDLLDAIELDGIVAGMRWLDQRGARWSIPTHQRERR
jgi:hypothetical protein